MGNKIIIAHRGNLNGPNPEAENRPDYLLFALSEGFNIELDLWFVEGQFSLGHDSATYPIKKEFLYQKGLWIHCKNIEALFELQNTKCNYFFHDKDDCTLTSHKFIWTYPGRKLTNKSIAVMPELIMNYDLSNAAGICTDYPFKYSENV